MSRARPPVRVLAIDTALDACQAAVVEDGRTLAARSEPMQRGHQERLAPMVRDVIAEARVGFVDLDRIAVTVGPGSFTGLRVGLAFAKGTALALGLPCMGVGALHALAASASGGRVAAVIDARRERCYMQLFAGPEPLTPPELLDLSAARARLADLRDIRLIGPGAALFGGPASPLVVPDIPSLARLAARLSPDDHPPVPLYLRGADALTIAERAARR